MRERSNQLERRKQLYQWQLFPAEGLPSGIDDTVNELPLDEEFGRVKTIDFTTDGLKGVLAGKLAGTTITVDTLRDYADLAKFINGGVLPLEQAGRWTSDVEFGRQMLNGVNPVVIRKCSSLPPNFPVTDEMVRPFLTRGMTLEQEMEVSLRRHLSRLASYPCRDLSDLDVPMAVTSLFNLHESLMLKTTQFQARLLLDSV